MKPFTLFCVVVLLGTSTRAFGQATEPASLETVLKEVRAIREKQAELDLRLKAIEKLLESRGGPAGESEFVPRGPNAEALSKITLPKNPTKEQVRQYVREILRISQGQNSFSSEDPQIRMLAMVGPDNVDVLLQELRVSNNSDVYLVQAITALARDDNKKMILEALRGIPQLADVVVAKGWTTDARSTLVDALQARPRFLPPAWIDAVASLQDPTTYDMLKDYLVSGANPWATYEAIKWLRDIDLKQAVADMWERHRNDEDYEGVAVIAMEFGHLDALERAISDLDKDTDDAYWPREFRKTLFRLTDARGTNEDIRKWFEKNRDKLVFDAKEKKFVVKNPQ